VPELPDLNHLSHAEKDALIRALWAQVQSLTSRVAALETLLHGHAMVVGGWVATHVGQFIHPLEPLCLAV
jgi:hypothetical protein